MSPPSRAPAAAGPAPGSPEATLGPLLPIGYGHHVVASRVKAIATWGRQASMLRLRDGLPFGAWVDLTEGRKTRSLLFMDDGSVVASAVSAEALEARWRGAPPRGLGVGRRPPPASGQYTNVRKET